LFQSISFFSKSLQGGGELADSFIVGMHPAGA
jgi:hypothetical protein